MTKPTKVARGWGIRVKSRVPHLSGKFFQLKDKAESYCGGFDLFPIIRRKACRPVRVVIISLVEYQELKRIEKENLEN